MSRFLLVVPILLVAACQPPPDDACNRVRFGWPFFELDPNSDVSDAEEGIQIDFDVRSDLDADVRVTLFLRVEAEDSQENVQVFLGEAVSDASGLLPFRNITIPDGEIVMILEARDDCGLHRTGRRLFVWDGLGFPSCDLSLATAPEMPMDGSIPVLTSEQDEDSGTPGMQVRVLVDAGRPDMMVTLFARDRERDENQEFTVPSDSAGLAEIPFTLPEGEQALRGVCYWESGDVRVNTATRVFFVEAP